MAEHGSTVEFGGTTGDDYPAHWSTYEAFVGLTKYGTIAARHPAPPDGVLPPLGPASGKPGKP